MWTKWNTFCAKNFDSVVSRQNADTCQWNLDQRHRREALFMLFGVAPEQLQWDHIQMFKTGDHQLTVLHQLLSLIPHFSESSQIKARQSIVRIILASNNQLEYDVATLLQQEDGNGSKQFKKTNNSKKNNNNNYLPIILREFQMLSSLIDTRSKWTFNQRAELIIIALRAGCYPDVLQTLLSLEPNDSMRHFVAMALVQRLIHFCRTVENTNSSLPIPTSITPPVSLSSLYWCHDYIKVALQTVFQSAKSTFHGYFPTDPLVKLLDEGFDDDDDNGDISPEDKNQTTITTSKHQEEDDGKYEKWYCKSPKAVQKTVSIIKIESPKQLQLHQTSSLLPFESDTVHPSCFDWPTSPYNEIIELKHLGKHQADTTDDQEDEEEENPDEKKQIDTDENDDDSEDNDKESDWFFTKNSGQHINTSATANTNRSTLPLNPFDQYQ